MNNQEKNFQETLKKMKNKYVALSLRPGNGSSIIEEAQKNKAFINEGRDGKFDNISESFYDQMVNLYDSRCKNK